MATLWFTGLSGAGKTTLANALQRHLSGVGRLCTVVDGDALRESVNRDLGFTNEDRREAVRRAAKAARHLNDSGHIALVAMISPLQTMRDEAKAIVAPHAFFEIYVSTSLAVCEARDVKGLYRRARAGLLVNFTGISSAYEPPTSPAAEIDTSDVTLQSAVRNLACLL